MQTKSLYQIREFTGNEYSKQLGQKLRARKDAQAIVRRLKQQHRDVFIAPIRVAA